MPNSIKKRWRSIPFILFLLFSIIMMVVITYFQWVLGIIAFLITGTIVYYLFKYEMSLYEEMEQYISTLSYRVKKVGEEALLEMPIGIVLFNDEYQIEWSNRYLASVLNEESLIGRHLNTIYEGMVSLLKGEEDVEKITLDERHFRVHINRDDKLLYFFDITEQTEILQLYEEEKIVLSVIFLDNYDEVTQGMDDQTKSSINSKVISILNNWANKHGIFLKRTSSDRFIAVFNQLILDQLEKTKFDILDEVRELPSKQNVPLTLSIGIGHGTSNLPELGALAQSSLDLALGRGGDQVAIKHQNGKVKFYGGKTNPMEKRTRVRARVISHALREWVLASDQVFIMGHKAPDMDAIGASIGVLKVAEANDRQGYIILDEQNIDSSVRRMMSEIQMKSELWNRFISPDDALEIATDHSLLVIVDTHKPSLVIDPRLLSKIDNVVVIDHHRRGEEFIENPVMVYMEPYASSTSELVTELLEYQPKTLKIDRLESTALLAGIIVDTKSFTLRTGSRTFDAASYLRSHGADTILVQKFLKEDLDQYLKRSKLIENTEIYQKGIAIAKADPDEVYNQVLIAQAADTLLSMNNISASFVISRRHDGKISISARSLGDVNVQIIMESLNGGGHLTNAATQIEGKSIDEVEILLKQAIDDYLEGGQKE